MNFVTIDFETANYAKESACSVGLVKYHDGIEIDTYYSLIRPPKLFIIPEFTKIHGLTVDDVRNAPKFNKIWDKEILPFIGDLPLAAHNAPFDMGVLAAAIRKYKLKVPPLPYFCTLHLSRKTWTHLKSHALTALAANFDIIYDAHNALDDARTCGKLVLMSANKNKTPNINELLSLLRIEMKELS